MTEIITTPRLGVVRESMRKDPLLIKAPLGKARTRGLTVPGPDFTYGTSINPVGDGGVAKVLSSWMVQSKGEDPAQTLDFVSLNRKAVRSGLVTSKELNRYRSRQAIRTTAQNRASLPPPVPPDVTFGVTNRSTSPIADLLSFTYGRRWLEEQSRNQTSNQDHQVKPGHVAENRTSLLRKSRSLPLLKPPFILPQFAQVPPALDTFRDPEARRRAFQAHRSKSGVHGGRQAPGGATDKGAR